MDQIDQREKTLVFTVPNQSHALLCAIGSNRLKTSNDPNYCVRVTRMHGERGEQWLGDPGTFQDTREDPSQRFRPLREDSTAWMRASRQHSADAADRQADRVQARSSAAAALFDGKGTISRSTIREGYETSKIRSGTESLWAPVCGSRAPDELHRGEREGEAYEGGTRTPASAARKLR